MSTNTRSHRSAVHTPSRPCRLLPSTTASPVAHPAGQPENWTSWWSAILADPVLAAAAARRDGRSQLPAHHTAESEVLRMHVAGLQAAGFTEIGTIWQHGGSRLLCAAAPS